MHQLPAKPAYLRVKVWRRLQALGAATVKNSVYVLPAGEQAQEDFEWLLKEIVEGGGEGMICEARLIEGLSDADVRDLFNKARAAEYGALAKDAQALARALDAEDAAPSAAEAWSRFARLRAEAARVASLDFFGADGREAAEGLLGGLELRLREEETMTEVRPEGEAADALKGRVWVTREGVQVDRIASAWLIRRFIDKEARFKFVPAKGYEPEPGELRFDMYQGEFTHEGDRCTFEVLLARSGLADPALVAIGEIVHDIDLKDGKFGRDATSGIAQLIAGIAAATRDDQARIARGATMLDDLYESFRTQRG
ncbi:MAG TPA: chromate resistance protein ChrB domain-containing protein [Acetobacteraceae bacterium]|nr:chromate resistance protein ChrB domain-containing protein [Acetobacteraceae bacterium]